MSTRGPNTAQWISIYGLTDPWRLVCFADGKQMNHAPSSVTRPGVFASAVIFRILLEAVPDPSCSNTTVVALPLERGSHRMA